MIGALTQVALHNKDVLSGWLAAVWVSLHDFLWAINSTSWIQGQGGSPAIKSCTITTPGIHTRAVSVCWRVQCWVLCQLSTCHSHITWQLIEPASGLWGWNRSSGADQLKDSSTPWTAVKKDKSSPSSLDLFKKEHNPGTSGQETMASGDYGGVAFVIFVLRLLFGDVHKRLWCVSHPVCGKTRPVKLTPLPSVSVVLWINRQMLT